MSYCRTLGMAYALSPMRIRMGGREDSLCALKFEQHSRGHIHIDNQICSLIRKSSWFFFATLEDACILVCLCFRHVRSQDLDPWRSAMAQ